MLENEIAEQAQKTFWIQNTDAVPCTFRSDSGRFRLESAGFVGSITQVDKRVAYDPYVKRAMSRGKIKMISEEEALEIMPNLEIREEESNSQSIMDALGEGASERVGRYRNQDLPEEAEARRAISANNVWGDNNGNASDQRHLRTVRRSSIDDGPILDVNSVLTDPEREE